MELRPAGSLEVQVYRSLEESIRDVFGKMWAEGITGAVQAESNKNTALEGGAQFSIRQTYAGQLYVQAERQVLSGDDPVQWGYQIENYINQTIRNGHDFVIPTRDGTHFLALTSRSAYKLKDRNIQSIRHDVEGMLTEEQYHLKGVAATHIDELIQVAIFSKYEPDINGWHENDIGEDGFNYFTSFFRDFDGKYYRVRFSSAINGNDETTYSIGDIRERRFPTDAGSSSQGEALKSGGKSSAKNNTTGQAESQGPKTALAAALEKAQQKKAQREKRSDRDYNQTVVLTEQTIDKYLADYAAKSSPNYAQAYIVRMTPNQFLDLTTSKTGRSRIYAETGDLDLDKLTDASIQQPFQLIIDTETGKISGHEGRHRAMALSNAGITSIPVLLFDSSNKYNKTAMEELTLHGQDFGSSRSFANVTVQDVQPLSYANRDNVVQKLTTQPSRERINEKYGWRDTVRYQERSYDTPSDMELLEGIDESGLKGDRNEACNYMYAMVQFRYDCFKQR